MKAVLAIIAGACYSAAYVCPKGYEAVFLIIASFLVIVMRQL